MNLFQLFFGFSGRVNRAKYWLAAVVYMVTIGIFVALAIVMDMAWQFYLLLALVLIPVTISSFAIGIKRLHDRDKSGWWILIFYGLPAVLSGLGDLIDASLIFGLASAAISIWGLIELGFLRGTSGANQYGPYPLAS